MLEGSIIGPIRKDKNDTANGFIFIHVPKTGGMSIRCLVSRYGKSVSSHHKSVLTYQEANGDDIFDSFPSYAVIRNPLDRIVSAYFYGRKRMDSPAFQERKAKELFSMDFDSYVRKLYKSPHMLENLLIARPQVVFLTDRSGKIPVKIYPFEYLNELATHLCNEYLGDYIELPTANATNHTHFMDYYTPETERMVLDLYAEDVMLYEKCCVDMIERVIKTT